MNRLITGVKKKAEEKQIDFEIIEYGFKVEMAFLIDVFLAMLFCSFIDQTWQSLIFITAFSFLRTECGGYHCKTYFTCGSLYICMVFSSCLLNCLFVLKGHEWLILVPIAYLYLVSPVQNENHTLCKEEKEVHKKQVRIRLMISCIAYFALWVMDQYIWMRMQFYVVLWLSLLCLIQQFQNRKGV